MNLNLGNCLQRSIKANIEITLIINPLKFIPAHVDIGSQSRSTFIAIKRNITGNSPLNLSKIISYTR